MKPKFCTAIFFLTIISWFSIGCGHDRPRLEDITNLEDLELEAPAHQLDTAASYCFQLGSNGLDEVFQLSIKGNRIKGHGVRIYTATQEAFNLTVDGVIGENNNIEVNVLSVHTRDAQNSFKKIEYWKINNTELIVENRDIENVKGVLKFYRVNCPAQESCDSSDYYDSLGGFYEGYAVASKGGYYGLVNEKREVTIPFKYRDLGIVNEGSIVFYDENSGLRGLLDVKGNILVPAIYPEIHCFNEGLAAFLTEDAKWGFMDKDQNVVIQPKYMNIDFFKPDPARHPFSEGLAMVQLENGLWNFINTKGETTIAGGFAFAKSFKNGKAEVFKDNKWFTIDKTGKCIANCD